MVVDDVGEDQLSVMRDVAADRLENLNQSNQQTISDNGVSDITRNSNTPQKRKSYAMGHAMARKSFVNSMASNPVAASRVYETVERSPISASKSRNKGTGSYEADFEQDLNPKQLSNKLVSE